MERSERIQRYQQQSSIADELAGLGNMEEAAAILQVILDEAAQAGDTDYQAFFEAEIIVYSSENYKAATERLEKEIELWSRTQVSVDPFILCALGGYHSLSGNEEEAIELCNKSLQINPTCWLAMRDIGVYLSRKGAMDQAIVWFNKALTINPKDWHSMRQMGVALSSKKNEDEAIKWYKRAFEENPNDWRSASYIGAELSNIGNHDEAIEWFDKALTINPNDWNAMREKGLALSNIGNHDEAIEWFDKALTINPTDWNSMREKGLALSKKGNQDESIEWFDKALVENPKDVHSMVNMGVSLIKKGKLDEAIEWFEKALSENPGLSSAMRHKGEALLEKGKQDEAIVWFDRALAINPTDGTAMYDKGVALSKKGSHDEAIVWHRRALALNPTNWNAMNNMGVSLSKKGKSDEAIVWYEKALEENPSASEAMRNKGFSLYMKGNLDEAIVWFDKALAVNPNDWYTMRNKGAVLFNLGKIDEGLEWAGRAAKMDPARWKNDFLAMCKLAGKDANREWQHLVGTSEKTSGGPSEETSGEFSPEPPDSFGELKAMINFIRTSIGEDANKFLEMKENAEKQLAYFLEPESHLDPERSLLMVLRKWNSYTPALPASPDDSRSRGGGYFIWHNGYGTVIDPGFNFIENFHAAGGRVCDIHNIILTHAHADHTAEFETLRTLLFEYNDNVREMNKTETQPHTQKRVRFFLNNGAFRKFAGILDLRDHGFTERVITLNRDAELELLGGGHIRVLPAYHDELLSRDQAVGLLFTFGEKEETRRILLTSDTGLFPLQPDVSKPVADDSDPEVEIGREYLKSVQEGDVDLMLVHIGSIKAQEFNLQIEKISEACYANHLGIIGTARVVAMCRPRLAVISEFGEEMRNFRVDLIKYLRDTVLCLYFKDKGGQSPRVVPGDLAFVYDIRGRTVLDCATKAWSAADTIDFWQDSNNDIFFAEKVPSTERSKLNCRERFNTARKTHEGLYFNSPQTPLGN